MNRVLQFLRALFLPVAAAAGLAMVMAGSPSGLDASMCRPDADRLCKTTKACVIFFISNTCTTTHQYGTLVDCPRCWDGMDDAKPVDPGPLG